MTADEDSSVRLLGTVNRLAVGSFTMKSILTWHVRGGPRDTSGRRGGVHRRDEGEECAWPEARGTAAFPTVTAAAAAAAAAAAETAWLA